MARSLSEPAVLPRFTGRGPTSARQAAEVHRFGNPLASVWSGFAWIPIGGSWGARSRRRSATRAPATVPDRLGGGRLLGCPPDFWCSAQSASRPLAPNHRRSLPCGSSGLTAGAAGTLPARPRSHRFGGNHRPCNCRGGKGSRSGSWRPEDIERTTTDWVYAWRSRNSSARAICAQRTPGDNRPRPFSRVPPAARST